MLDKPKRAGLSPALVFLLVAAVGGGGWYLGDRHGHRMEKLAGTGPGGSSAAALALDAGAPLLPVPGAATAGAGGVAPAPLPDAGTASTSAAEHALALTLKGSLDQAVQEAVTTSDGPALTMVISRLLVWWLNPARDARPGDKLWVVYALPEGQEPLVLALRYQSQKLGATKTAIRFLAPGATFARYYDETGTEVEERLVDSPLADYEQITSLLRDGRGHKGVDFKVPVGTPVLSPVDGVVTKKNWKVHANGDCLGVLDRKTQRELLFLHLSEVLPDIRVGSQVKQGQVIAKSGNTGHTTAPHLHYQMMSPDNRVLDPFAVQETTHRKLPPAVLPELRKALGELATDLGPEPKGRG